MSENNAALEQRVKKAADDALRVLAEPKSIDDYLDAKLAIKRLAEATEAMFDEVERRAVERPR